MAKLSAEQKQIMEFLSKFGCVDMEQLYIIMRPLNSELVTILINMLIKSNHIEIVSGHYLVLKGQSGAYCKETILCIWTMMELSRDREDYFNALAASSPAKIYFTSKGTNAYELIPINETKLINVRAVQDKIMERNHQFETILDSWIVFVCDNREIIYKIKECKLQFPFIVSYVQPSEIPEGKPMIRLLKSTPKTG